MLAASDETRMRGRYGLWFDRESGHARLGDVISEDDRVVRRRLDSVDFGRLERAERGRMNGWYHLGPWELGHPYENVVADFRNWYADVIYIVAMLALGLHIRHGLWSAAQTLGATSRRRDAAWKAAATLLALVVTAGFIAVPVSVMTGVLS